MKGMAYFATLLALSFGAPLAAQDPPPEALQNAGECWYVVEAPDAETNQKVIAGTGSIVYSPVAADKTSEVTQSFEIKISALAAIDPGLARNPVFRQVQHMEMQMDSKEKLNDKNFTTSMAGSIASGVFFMAVTMDHRMGTWTVDVNLIDDDRPIVKSEGPADSYGSLESALLAAAREGRLSAGTDLTVKLLSVDAKSAMISVPATITVVKKDKIKWPAGSDTDLEVWELASDLKNEDTGEVVEIKIWITTDGYIHELHTGDDYRLLRVKDREAARGKRSWSNNKRRDIFEKSLAKIPKTGPEDEVIDDKRPADIKEKQALIDIEKGIKEFRALLDKNPTRDAKQRGYNKIKGLLTKAKAVIKSPDGKGKYDNFERDLDRSLGRSQACLMEAGSVFDEINANLAKNDVKKAKEVLARLQPLANDPRVVGQPEQKEIEGMVDTARKAIGGIELGGYLTAIEIKGLVYHWENQIDVIAIDAGVLGATLDVRQPISMTRPRAMVLVTGLPPREGHGDFEIMREGDYIEDLKGPTEPIMLKEIKLNEVIFASGNVEAPLAFPKKKDPSKTTKPGR